MAVGLLFFALISIALGCCGGAERTLVLNTITSGDPLRGRQALEAYGCEACHTIPGVPGATAHIGPTLKEFAYRQYLSGGLANTPENLVAWIMDPQAIEPNSPMPDLDVAEPEAWDMAAYLATLR